MPRPRLMALGLAAGLVLVVSACQQAERLNTRGLALRDQGELERAVATFERAIGLEPMSAPLHYNLALTWQDIGVRDGDEAALERAAAGYAHALSLQPDIERAHTNRAIALGQLGRDREALVSYGLALDQDPADDRARINRGNLLLRHGEAEAALADYERVMAGHPGSWQAMVGAARVHHLAGDDEKARTLAARARDLAPEGQARKVIEAFLADLDG